MLLIADIHQLNLISSHIQAQVWQELPFVTYCVQSVRCNQSAVGSTCCFVNAIYFHEVILTHYEPSVVDTFMISEIIAEVFIIKTSKTLFVVSLNVC